MQIRSFGQQGWQSRPFTDIKVDCDEVSFRAVVDVKTVPVIIPLVECNVRPTTREEAETKGTLIHEQHRADGRCARLDLTGLFSRGFTLAGVKQTKTKNDGIRAVYFRIVRDGAGVTIDDSVSGFFVKLACARWAHAKMFSNLAIRNEAGEIIVPENITINTLEVLGGQETTRTFRFK